MSFRRRFYTQDCWNCLEVLIPLNSSLKLRKHYFPIKRATLIFGTLDFTPRYRIRIWMNICLLNRKNIYLFLFLLYLLLCQSIFFFFFYFFAPMFNVGVFFLHVILEVYFQLNLSLLLYNFNFRWYLSLQVFFFGHKFTLILKTLSLLPDFQTHLFIYLFEFRMALVCCGNQV